MKPNLAQVLNTLAHEIRSPLAVSQGYLKLILDGRLTNADDQRRAFEQTRAALGTLNTLCMDMSKVSALSESTEQGLVERITASQLVDHLRAAPGVGQASWSDNTAGGTAGDAAGSQSITSHNAQDLAQAIAIVTKAAFDEDRDGAHVMRAEGGQDLIVLAGPEAALPALAAGPDAPTAAPVDFARGGKGLKLIWAGFVLQKDRVQTWTHKDHRASVGFRIPLGAA
jgi:signal transduction histidine kinase